MKKRKNKNKAEYSWQHFSERLMERYGITISRREYDYLSVNPEVSRFYLGIISKEQDQTIYLFKWPESPCGYLVLVHQKNPNRMSTVLPWEQFRVHYDNYYNHEQGSNPKS